MGQRAQNAPPGRAWRAMRASTKRRTDRMLGSIAATVARALPEEAGRVRPCCLSCAVADPRAQELAPTKVRFQLRRARRGSLARVHEGSRIPDVDRRQAHRGGQRHCSQRLHCRPCAHAVWCETVRQRDLGRIWGRIGTCSGGVLWGVLWGRATRALAVLQQVRPHAHWRPRPRASGAPRGTPGGPARRGAARAALSRRTAPRQLSLMSLMSLTTLSPMAAARRRQG